MSTGTAPESRRAWTSGRSKRTPPCRKTRFILASLRSSGRRHARRGPGVDPPDDVRKDRGMIGLVQEIMIEAVIEDERLVVRSGPAHEFLAAIRVADLVLRPRQHEERRTHLRLARLQTLAGGNQFSG